MSDKCDERKRFERLAEKRTKSILKRLDVLENCADRNRYEYTEQEIDEIFKAIRRKVKKTKAEFEFPEEEEEFSL